MARALAERVDLVDLVCQGNPSKDRRAVVEHAWLLGLRRTARGVEERNVLLSHGGCTHRTGHAARGCQLLTRGRAAGQSRGSELVKRRDKRYILITEVTTAFG